MLWFNRPKALARSGYEGEPWTRATKTAACLAVATGRFRLRPNISSSEIPNFSATALIASLIARSCKRL